MENTIEWTQVLVIVGANFALLLGFIGTAITMFLWARSEARVKAITQTGGTLEDRKNAEKMIYNIQQEMKDFHGRMCSLEERRLKEG